MLGSAPHRQGCVAFRLAAVHPALEERTEVLCALCYFVVQCLLSDPAAVELHQGSLRLVDDVGGAGPGAVIARFVSSPQPHHGHHHSGELSGGSPAFGRVSFPSTPLDMQGGRGFQQKAPAGSGVALREVRYTPGSTLDGIIAKVVEGMSLLAGGLVDSDANNALGGSLSLASAEGDPDEAAAPALDPLRSKANSIVEEARRVTQQLNILGSGKQRESVVQKLASVSP